jgi:erythronate-4-phosphate dehydrogenase
MQIVIDQDIPFIAEILKNYGDVLALPGAQIRNHHLTNADALFIRTRTQVNQDLLQNTKVRFVATATIGTDHIDQKYCRSAGVQVVSAPGCNSGGVVQYVLTVLAHFSLKFKRNLRDLTLGVVGAGHVGSRLVTAAKILGMNVMVNDPPRARIEGEAGFCSLHDLIAKADVISLHVPLNKSGVDKTLGLISGDSLAKMKSNVLLINTSRGGVIDESELLNHLNQDSIFCPSLVLDVWNKEPNIDLDLLKKTWIATPHIAGYSYEGKTNGSQMVLRAFADYFNLNTLKKIELSLPEAKTLEPSDAVDSMEQVLNYISACFDIFKLHRDLLNDPPQFEALRVPAHSRREFGGWRLPGDPSADLNIPLSLGFLPPIS